MSFASPQFFLLIPLLFLATWLLRRLELWRPLRIILILLLIFAICDPLIKLKRGGMDLWVLLDRSASAREMVDAGEREWKALLENSKPGSDYRVNFLDYAAEVIPTTHTENSIFSGNRSLTRTSLAIRDALARMDQTKHNRLLVFTDGYSTEPLTGITEKLLREGIPLDYRQLRPPEVVDYQVAELNFRTRVQPGEPFIVDAVISANATGTVPVTVSRAGKTLFTRNVEVENGRGRLRFSDRIVQPGAHQYVATIKPETDAHEGNNRQEKWVEVVSGPRIVLLTNYIDDPMAKVLRSQGFAVDMIEDTLLISPGILTGACAVVLNNVPSYELPNDFLTSLDFFVNEQGGGLLMAGGKNSFGSGGYYQSALDPLLPVTMELKSEHRKLSVAMGIVMDRSGSMGMTTPSGHSKMQLANEGAARAVELLGDMDAVTVFAVDSLAHDVTGLLNVGTSRGELLSRIRSIESMGGGIFVYTGMSAAWKELQKADVGQRHMILFSDAADSEEPGKYKELLNEMSADGATVSVIGLGNRSDPDAAFLEDISKRGGGRMFFTDVPGDIPNIFAQETVTVARSTFIDDIVGTQSTGRWYEFARTDLEWPGQIDGYNLSYIREGDEAAVVTTDTYSAPLVAFGRRGIGKTAAVSFPLGGDYSETIRTWELYGDFLQTLTRWLMGEDVPPGIGLRHNLTGTELTIDLLYNTEEWTSRFAEQPPELMLSRGNGRIESESVTWERLSPGHYSVKTSLKENEPVRGSVKIAGAAIPFGPVVAGAAAEWAFDEARLLELRETATTTGGSEILDLTGAWRKPPSPGYESVKAWFLIAALLLFLMEAFATRTGWRLPAYNPSRLKSPKPSKERAAQEEEKAPAEEKPEPALESPAPPSPKEEEKDNTASRRSRFNRAKKRL